MKLVKHVRHDPPMKLADGLYCTEETHYVEYSAQTKRRMFWSNVLCAILGIFVVAPLVFIAILLLSKR